MPVAEFPGRHGWGYDGVYLSAAQSSYGGPDGFARLVDAAHAAGPRGAPRRGLQPRRRQREHGDRRLRLLLHRQVLDVLGPGDQLRRRRACDPVREWVLQSAEGWIRDFHLDGLRLDAIHAIYDGSARPVLREIAARVHAVDPRAHVIAESGLNDPVVTRPPEEGGLGHDAAWADDFHHSLRTPAHRGAGGLLRGVRHDRRPREMLPPAVPARRDVVVLPRPPLRCARARPAGPRVRRLRRQPRPGRQPRARRPPAGRAAPARGLRDAALPVHADAVDGGGVRGARALPVLLRPHRRGDRGRPPARGAGGSSRPSPRSRARRFPTRWTRGRSSAPSSPAREIRRCSRCTARCWRHGGSCPRVTSTRSSATRRAAGCVSVAGAFELCMNFGPEPVLVPATGGEVVVATHSSATSRQAGGVQLPGRGGALVGV